MSTERPRIGNVCAVLTALVAEEHPDPARLGALAAMLFEVPSYAAVPLLLPLLRHGLARVRVGAVLGLAAHPYPVVLKVLDGVALEDRALSVRAAAQRALDDFDTTPIPCLQCSVKDAVLAPAPANDPHGEQLPKPMFCSEACAVRWALGEAPDLYHHCVTALRWERGSEDECDVCSNASVLGAEAEEEPR